MKTKILIRLLAATLLVTVLTAAAQTNVVQGTNLNKAKASAKAKAPDVYDASVPKPTFAEVRYGPHERNVLDFWKADSDKPTPLVFFIHGGGWTSGSKERISGPVDVAALLKAGIS
ncbi:MAG: hypothetical protein RLY20_865, partial [Verrucomicrobiota bacterium]